MIKMFKMLDGKEHVSEFPKRNIPRLLKMGWKEIPKKKSPKEAKNV